MRLYIEFVTNLLWAYPQVNFTYESSATPKISLNVVVQCSGCVIFLVIFFGPQKTHITDVTEARSWLSASGLETVMAPGTEHSWARSSYTIPLG